MAVETSQASSSLPYHEPGIIIILVQTSYLLLLNIVNSVLDKLLYCGLLGQVLVGIAWGSPGAKWLPVEMEETVVQLGYLGLILLVYEGGLHTSFQSLKANLALSTGVALTGIVVPVGLSYTLQGLLNATAVQAFAAGAALCSTSLGTTFTVLAASGLSATRLGVVLTSAAMMDDVVGLVMVQVISNLGEDDFSWVTVVRPILVSVAFAVVAPMICLFVVKPITLQLNSFREAKPKRRINSLLHEKHTALALHTALLVGLVAAASYAGTSNLFAAYIAGATISWWDSELPHPAFNTDGRRPRGAHDPKTEGIVNNSPRPPCEEQSTPTSNPERTAAYNTETQSISAPGTTIDEGTSSGPAIYHRYYHSVVMRLLQPLFFASIGFSIPITRMFRGDIIWKGIIYTVLMSFGKLVCGLWLVRFESWPGKSKASRLLAKVKMPTTPHFWGSKTSTTTAARASQEHPGRSELTSTSHQESQSSLNPPKPFSLHPPLILALAMCARGEIGFLISGVAESKGIFSLPNQTSAEPTDIYLVITWAIVLCTIIGPLGVGLSVRRVKKLQMRKKQQQQQEGTQRDVLGVWGLE